MIRRIFLSLLVGLSAKAVQAGVIFHQAVDKICKPGAQDLPELWYWGHDGCQPCKLFQLDYEKGKEDCGFVTVKQEGDRPTWMSDSNPQFWWHVKEKQPTQKDVSNTRHQDGYPGWKVLVEKFQVSRKQNPQQAGRPAKVPFVQPDQQNSRAVALKLTYHKGHNCPSCNHQQFSIANHTGPGNDRSTHIPKCGNCDTKWYHEDGR